MNLDLLAGCVPLRLFTRDGRALVDWVCIDGERFSDPFFEQTVARCLRHPANVLFRHQTPFDVLKDLLDQRPAPPPNGFIFHMSRCGSTLISQMLAAIERSRVLSEARPIDQILGAPMEESQRVRAFKCVVNALTQLRPGEDSSFIKFDAWHVLHLSLIARAYPETPWIFAYRDPVEVMVSQQRQRGVQVIPGALSPALFGLDSLEPWITRLDEYAARVLGRICEAAWEHRDVGRGLLVNFNQLPAAVPGIVRDFLHLTYSPEEGSQMISAGSRDAKQPSFDYKSDTARKQQEATPEIRELAAQFIEPAYERLEQARLAAV